MLYVYVQQEVTVKPIYVSLDHLIINELYNDIDFNEAAIGNFVQQMVTKFNE